MRKEQENLCMNTYVSENEEIGKRIRNADYRKGF
jgi:hypothetical protein